MLQQSLFKSTHRKHVICMESTHQCLRKNFSPVNNLEKSQPVYDIMVITIKRVNHETEGFNILQILITIPESEFVDKLQINDSTN